ncbi:ABC transporter permease subunit, partial [Variovorax sp. CT11-76]
MWRWIANREFTERLRDGRLLWAGGLVLVLLFTALGGGWAHQREARAEQQAAQALDYRDWLAQDRRHPHDAAHQGMHAFKPEAPLAMVDAGINPYIGSTVWLQAHRQSEVKFNPAQDATGLQRFGNLSVGWILQVLGPLLVIVLGFNAFAGEREQGILRQTLSLGVSPLRLLAGKALALAASLAV